MAQLVPFRRSVPDLGVRRQGPDQLIGADACPRLQMPAELVRQ